jgi:hypothetical protein
MIADATVAPGHDGEAVLVVRLRHENGAFDMVTLDADRARALLEACAATTAVDLRGQPWRHLLRVLEQPKDREE